MQELNETFLDFLERTDVLTSKLGISKIDEMPDKLGISRASFYSYRSGKRPISRKAWAKLRALEEAHGIVSKMSQEVPNLKREAQESSELIDIEERIKKAKARKSMLLSEIESLNRDISAFTEYKKTLLEIQNQIIIPDELVREQVQQMIQQIFNLAAEKGINLQDNPWISMSPAACLQQLQRL